MRRAEAKLPWCVAALRVLGSPLSARSLYLTREGPQGRVVAAAANRCWAPGQARSPGALSTPGDRPQGGRDPVRAGTKVPGAVSRGAAGPFLPPRPDTQRLRPPPRWRWRDRGGAGAGSGSGGSGGASGWRRW